jgi:hypothetical protein
MRHWLLIRMEYWSLRLLFKVSSRLELSGQVTQIAIEAELFGARDYRIIAT